MTKIFLKIIFLSKCFEISKKNVFFAEDINFLI